MLSSLLRTHYTRQKGRQLTQLCFSYCWTGVGIRCRLGKIVEHKQLCAAFFLLIKNVRLMKLSLAIRLPDVLDKGF